MPNFDSIKNNVGSFAKNILKPFENKRKRTRTSKSTTIPPTPISESWIEYLFKMTKDTGYTLYEWTSWVGGGFKRLINEPVPTDKEEFKVYMKRKEEEQKDAELQARLNSRKKELREAHKIDLSSVTTKKTTCLDWHKSVTKDLVAKLAEEENLYITPEDRSNPARVPGWHRKDFNHDYHSEKLCENLYCSSSKPNSRSLTLPASVSKKCHAEEVEIRDLKRQLELYERNTKKISDNYENYIDDYQTHISYLEQKIEKIENANLKQKRLELPGSTYQSDQANPSETIPVPFEDLGFLNFIRLPVNVATGNTFNLTKNKKNFYPFYKLFELSLAALICLMYLATGTLIFYVFRYLLDHTKDSIEHWSATRRERAKDRLEEERLEKKYKRRRRSIRDLGRNTEKVANSTMKKIGSLFSMLRGGSIIPVSEIETEQILIAYDPIFQLIKMERYRLEICEIIEIYETTHISKRARIRSKIDAVGQSISSKCPSMVSLQANISTIVGWVTLATGAGLTMAEPIPNRNQYFGQTHIAQIERNVNLNMEITQEIEEVAEFLEIQIESQTSEPKQNVNQKRRKDRKFNRQIHKLDDLPSLKYSSESENDESIAQKNQHQRIKIR